MAIQWSEFRKVSEVRRGGLRASINRAGVIALNRKAWEELGEPDAAILLYDEYNRVIGLKPAHPRLENAVPFRSKYENQKRFVIRAIALCNHLSVNITNTLIFRNPTIIDGVLVLELRDTYEFNTRRNFREHEEEM
mgnify:CR=1 FL=1